MTLVERTNRTFRLFLLRIAYELFDRFRCRLLRSCSTRFSPRTKSNASMDLLDRCIGFLVRFLDQSIVSKVATDFIPILKIVTRVQTNKRIEKRANRNSYAADRITRARRRRRRTCRAVRQMAFALVRTGGGATG